MEKTKAICLHYMQIATVLHNTGESIKKYPRRSEGTITQL
jgi:hypothetical protein